VVCNPRKNALLKDGSKSDRIDARKLAELLRGNHLKPVYHGEQDLRTLKELARSYLIISKDVTRVMNRLKALYRSWGIACAGTKVDALADPPVERREAEIDGCRCLLPSLYNKLPYVVDDRRGLVSRCT
jgi:hypothetical protein